MRQIIEQELGNFGRPPKLSRADQLLLTLMYWREYRTEFHIGLDYDISEKAVQSGSMALEIILVDAT
jgi:hypothetical protein